MVSIGYFLSCEEFGPRELVDQARRAEQAGFTRLWISDHFHPWNGEQGNSPFVWSVIGALSEAVSLPVTTAVTCPTVRIHPAIIAQAAATAAVQLQGRFVLGVGSGEALNEHILGDAWPPAPVRQDMLEEAIALIRELHTGNLVTHHGEHYVVENARIYTLPSESVPIYVSAFGEKAAKLAAEIGDGFCTTQPDAALVEAYRKAGGKGPTQGGMKVCYAPDRASAVTTVHRLWPNEQLPGQLAQELATPLLFEQASELITEDIIDSSPLPLGPDLDQHAKSVQEYVDAGFDEVYVQQIGPDQEAFFAAWQKEVLPRFS
ncbi:TIGR03557 family F420-dependent LLM class oxidoreductase [Cryptosporangium sp. NPDC048952]|uniref:TIGR03557 family F420-dependent LLM class oxidoreductase n=1 Tax=Cryptosporangium sp. NPDC048952 TaxID=3363961 RepID=UPI003716FCC8